MRFGHRAGLPINTVHLKGLPPWRRSSPRCSSRPTAWPRSTPTGTSRTSTTTWGRAVGEDYDTADVLLLGRETYDSFAGAWPDREAAGGDDAPFAKQLGDMRKVVVSRQPLEFAWRNSELIEGDLVEAVTALKADPAVTGILIPGSISVVQQLLAAGLVDELRLLVHPVAARRAAGSSTRATPHIT